MEAKVYRRGLTAGLAAALLAALVLAVIDVALVGGAAPGPLIGLWLGLGLLLGLAWGVVVGAGQATWGDGFLRRGLASLAEHRERDRSLTGAILAGLLVALPAVVLIGKLSVALVGHVERKAVGGLLLGVVVIALVPVLALAALPVYRLVRPLTALVPRSGKLPAALVLVGGGALAVVGLGALFVLTRLDWRALRLGSLVALAALPMLTAIFTVWTARWASGPRAGGLGLATWAAAAVAVALPAVALRGTPDPTTSRVVLDESWLGSRAVPVLRSVLDRDGDGESAFYGGPDCDDRNPAVYSSANEIAGNGIDDNCLGGDGKPAAPASAAASPAAAPTPTAPPRAGAFSGNLLILFIDTLRGDRLGSTGYQRDGKSLTPRLDGFAESAVVFRKAFAQAPNTPRSVPSFLASRYPSALGFDKDFVDYPTLRDDNDLLFEVLAGAGLHTAAETSHFYFCDQVRAPEQCTGFKRPKHSNIRQGAAYWNNEGAVDVAPSNKDIAAPRIVPRAIAKLAELAKQKQRFAMMVHLFEPHSTYMEHEGWPVTERGTAALAQKYDYEIAYTDGWVGKLLDALDEHGLTDQTAVVVLSDHGEAFGVHSMAGQRMFFHGQTLYNELISVPLMLRVPQVAPRQVDDVVQLLDLAPTLVDLLGLAAPASWQGRSLLPLLRGETLPPAPAFAELMPAPAWNHDARAMITGDGTHKVIFRKSDNRWEVYDLTKDPEETKDVSQTSPRAEALRQELTAWIERMAGG